MERNWSSCYIIPCLIIHIALQTYHLCLTLTFNKNTNTKINNKRKKSIEYGTILTINSESLYRAIEWNLLCMDISADMKWLTNNSRTGTILRTVKTALDDTDTSCRWVSSQSSVPFKSKKIEKGSGLAYYIKI